jgi:glycosyltransferase involved in cell wall biosynthesis
VRILWFNWRDLKNPDAGGAEVFTHEVMTRLAKMGYEITLFCPLFPNAARKEKIDGIEIIRSGGVFTVYLKAKQFYKRNKDRYDLVIDEINGKPFLSPKIVGDKPVLVLFHQLIHDIWFYETHFPLNCLCYYYLEKKWLSSYKNIPAVTVSASSKRDLEKHGFNKVSIVSVGVANKPLEKVGQKEFEPTIVFLGRLKRHKMPDHALRAFALIKNELPNAKMWVIGEGNMHEELKMMKIKDVVFYGHIKNELKYELLRKAHLLFVPSIREGWGLVVTEANAMGTPAIAYDAPGLRDSVVNGKTGILVKDKSPQNLASSALTLLKNPGLLKIFSDSALTFSKQFSWDNTAAEFDKIIRHLIPDVDIELEKAIKVLKKSEQGVEELKESEQQEAVYKRVGGLLIKTKKDDTLKELEKKKDLSNT